MVAELVCSSGTNIRETYEIATVLAEPVLVRHRPYKRTTGLRVKDRMLADTNYLQCGLFVIGSCRKVRLQVSKAPHICMRQACPLRDCADILEILDDVWRSSGSGTLRKTIICRKLNNPLCSRLSFCPHSCPSCQQFCLPESAVPQMADSSPFYSLRCCRRSGISKAGRITSISQKCSA